MQAYQRIEGGSKQVRADGEMVFENQLTPFESGRNQEFQSEQDGGRPPQLESPEVTFFKRVLGQIDGKATRKKTNRRDNGQLQHVLRIRSVQATAGVDQI